MPNFVLVEKKAKILTTGIHLVFRGLKFEPDLDSWAKGGIFQRFQLTGISKRQAF
jgi:hypothetical protein